VDAVQEKLFQGPFAGCQPKVDGTSQMNRRDAVMICYALVAINDRLEIFHGAIRPVGMENATLATDGAELAHEAFDSRADNFQGRSAATITRCALYKAEVRLPVQDERIECEQAAHAPHPAQAHLECMVRLRGPSPEMSVQTPNIAVLLCGYAVADIRDPAGSLAKHSRQSS
jgi:hypothetical protein